MIVSAVSIVISVFIGILGLKLIRVWNAVIGFVAGALLGFAVTYLMGLEVVPVLIAAGVAGLVFAILNSVFKKFRSFLGMLSGNGWHSACDYKCGKLDHAGSLRSSRTDFRNPCDDLV